MNLTIKQKIEYDILDGVSTNEYFYLHVPDCTPKEGDDIVDFPFVFKLIPHLDNNLEYSLYLYTCEDNIFIGDYLINIIKDVIYDLLVIYYSNKKIKMEELLENYKFIKEIKEN